MNIASFFSGCGGLDLGFSKAGFKIVFANDNWQGCKQTFEKNHKVTLDTRSITDLKSEDIPQVIGFVGGPPCQSWSLGGAMRGIKDPRGQVFYDYIRLLEEKKPLFFLAENVAGILSSTHRAEFEKILTAFKGKGYELSYELLDAKDFGVPQERKRVIIVGYHKKLGRVFHFPKQFKERISLKQAIGGLVESTPAIGKNSTNGDRLPLPNHEHMTGGFSTIYMSRNRKKEWDEQSFTIQAGGRHAPIHPSASPMIKKGKDEWVFDKSSKCTYRRLSVRECARIQTFPDDFIFIYNNVSDGYKMIGNAVPVKLAEILAKEIANDLKEVAKEKCNGNIIALTKLVS